MSIDNISERIAESKTAGRVSDWAYGKTPDAGWEVVLTKDNSATSGFQGHLFVNKSTREVWFGIAGTDQKRDAMQYPAVYGIQHSSQILEGLQFVKQGLGVINGNSEYAGYKIRIAAESWGATIAEVASYTFGLRGYGIDGPGGLYYILSPFYCFQDAPAVGVNPLAKDPRIDKTDFTALKGTGISGFGAHVAGTLIGNIYIRNGRDYNISYMAYDKKTLFAEHLAANETVANGFFIINIPVGDGNIISYSDTDIRGYVAPEIVVSGLRVHPDHLIYTDPYGNTLDIDLKSDSVVMGSNNSNYKPVWNPDTGVVTTVIRSNGSDVGVGYLNTHNGQWIIRYYDGSGFMWSKSDSSTSYQAYGTGKMSL
jgi:hypothetical protein